MYGEKQFHLWLMVIPFLVVQILGSHSIFSKSKFLNVFNGYIKISACFLCDLDENSVAEFVGLGYDNQVQNDVNKKRKVDFDNYTYDFIISEDNNKSNFCSNNIFYDRKINRTNICMNHMCESNKDIVVANNIYIL